MKRLQCSKMKQVKVAETDTSILKRNIQFVMEKEIKNNKEQIERYENNTFFPKYFETAYDWIHQCALNEYIATSPEMFKYWVPTQNAL